MGYDAFAPISPARINAEIVPAGPLKTSRFNAFVARLAECRTVQPFAQSEDSDHANQRPGKVVYDFSPSQGGRPSLDAFPFDLNRQPQVVLAVADGNELFARDGEGAVDRDSHAYQNLLLEFERQQTVSSPASPHFLLIFDAPAETKSTSDNVFTISSTNIEDVSTETAMSSLTAMLLAQLFLSIRDLEAHLINSPQMLLRNREGMFASDLRPGSSGQSSKTTELKRSPIPSTNSATSSEAKATTSKARYRIVLGAFYIQAGRFFDALRELSEGAIATRSTGDDLWHGKALEHLIVCMLMLAWAEMNFEIPNVCRPAVEKGLLSRPSPNTPRNGSPALAEAPETSHGFEAVLQDLAQLLPTMASKIMTLYARASNFTQEQLPLTMMCEARIRLANLLMFSHLDDTSLDIAALSCLVLGTQLEANHLNAATAVPRARKTVIANLLIEAVTESHGEISNNDLVYILIGVVSGLSKLDSDRKQAFYLKELLQKLVPCLVEARKLGAAEMGIHPAAGLSILSGGAPEPLPNLRKGTADLLDLIGSYYGTSTLTGSDTIVEAQSDLVYVRGMLLEWISSQRDGDISLKLEILRLCINVCEALPDLAAGLRFTIQLLQTARRTITLSTTSTMGTPLISTEEQDRLYNSIKRTVNAAPKIGLTGLRADYWDDFLVRGARLLDVESTTKLIPYTPQELAIAVGEKRPRTTDPFIYNPFSRTHVAVDTVTVAVAGELAHFVVTLQNPFDFDVEIDHISLITEGCPFDSQSHSVVLGRFCTQKITLSGKPLSSGALRITGCQVAVRCCHEKAFSIFNKEWHPPKTSKLKHAGSRTGSTIRLAHQTEILPRSADAKSINDFLQPDILSITVIQPQPEITVASTSLNPPSLMLLEGETKEFEITLQNSSKMASADLILFKFQDSVTVQLQTALDNKELSPVELYELQYQLSTNPPIRRKTDAEDRKPYLPPDSHRTFTFEAFGKPGLTSAIVHINYAHVGMPVSEVKEKFHTRQLSFAIALTVNGSVDIPRFNILPLSDSFAWGQEQINLSNGKVVESEGSTEQGEANDTQLSSHLSALGLAGQQGGSCLGVVDFRNVWPHPILIEIATGTADLDEGVQKSQPKTHTNEILQPGHISRTVLVLPRLFISDTSAPVPAIGNQRQFVLSASKVSMEAEAVARELFWYREKLLKHISGTWKELDTGRKGMIDFRKAVRLSARMIDTIREDHVEIEFSVEPYQDEVSNVDHQMGNLVPQLSKSHFILHTETFATLIIRIRNRTKEQLRLLLRLQPSLRNQPHNIALELSKRFAWSGVLQRALHPALEPGEVREARLGITALVEGDFEVGATVEEIQGHRQTASSKAWSTAGISTERRIWHARESCLIDAVEVRRGDE